MAASFFFYDLETSGTDSQRDRIMQFAGQRTDMDLNPIGEPIDIMVALTDEILPEPGAIMVTGITPQKTREEGYTEAEFLKIFHEQVLTPDTIILGYNNINFDDKFMQCTLYRNMYDPYEWQWREGRSRWDLLDVVRLTRALRPDGIEWPFDEHGVPTNKLDRITIANGVEHENAHDALADVTALINVAALIKDAQPKLYDYLLKNREKRAVQGVIGQTGAGVPFVHTSYVYPKEVMHTSVATVIGEGQQGEHFVFDLRYDPQPWLAMSADELRMHCQKTADQRGDDHEFIPVQKLRCNQCPAVAPYNTLTSDKAAQERINIDLGMVERHLALLKQHPEFGRRVVAALERKFDRDDDPECQLYDGFVPDSDKAKMATVRAATKAADLKDFDPGFSDKRLQQMLVRYKARNYPQSLTDDERSEWEEYRAARLQKGMPHFIEELQKISTEKTDSQTQYLIEELRLYAESIMP